MLTQEQIQQAAGDLHQAEKQRIQLEATTVRYPDMDMDDAYAIQKAWVDMKLEEGRTIKGYKLGLTSRAMQMSSQIDEPDYGPLLDDMFFDDGHEGIPKTMQLPFPHPTDAGHFCVGYGFLADHLVERSIIENQVGRNAKLLRQFTPDHP